MVDAGSAPASWAVIFSFTLNPEPLAGEQRVVARLALWRRTHRVTRQEPGLRAAREAAVN